MSRQIQRFGGQFAQSTTVHDGVRWADPLEPRFCKAPMSNIVPFNFEGSNVRVVEYDGEPWFVAVDVARVLGYERPHNAVAAHCKGSLKQGVLTVKGLQETILIPERDVYRLIMRSKLPSAERFEEWVVGEVLPSIRKTGTYSAPSAAPALPDLSNPVVAAEQLIVYAGKFLEAQKALVVGG